MSDMDSDITHTIVLQKSISKTASSKFGHHRMAFHYNSKSATFLSITTVDSLRPAMMLMVWIQEDLEGS